MLVMGICAAQNFGGGRQRGGRGGFGGGFGGGFRGGGGFGRSASSHGVTYSEGGVPVDQDTVKTAREVESHSTGTPNWTNKTGFEKDVVTFVRVIRDRSGNTDGGSWITDFPDSDLNLSFRIQQVTAMKVDPNGRTLRLTDPDILNYPWIYMVEVGSLSLEDDEVTALRKYLLNGGVLMVDDFWGERQWNQFESQIKRALPERHFQELDITHPIFHCVFDLKGSVADLQSPGIMEWRREGSDPRMTWEYHSGEECRPMHVRAILDDKGRIMVLATFNCDNGDGWEREGEDEEYFNLFSEKRAYPLGINIIYYLMTH